MSTLKKEFKEVAELVDEKLDAILPEPKKGRIGESRLAEAMRYTVLGSGKRLRPFLVVKSADLFGVSRSSSLQVAAAIELIHAYSLVHDDLPAMDDDDMRRGKPSLHKQYDEATAILAGDAILTFAFEVLAHHSTHHDPAVRSDLVLSFAQSCGIAGMVGGQMMDLMSEDREMTIEDITRLQRMKTGALFAISCEAGAILGKASRSMRSALKAFAYDVGLAFQITDDLLDAEEGVENPTEDERHDKSSEKGTFISAMGKERTKKQVEVLTSQAIEHLKPFGKRAEIFHEFADYVVHREF